MKIVQSFWSKPFYHKKINTWEGRKAGGWNDPLYYYMSCTLSCLLLCKYYTDVELVTDEKGKELLIDRLKLPYKNVVCQLDKLNNYPEDLWSVGKIYTYSMQRTPFLHFDSDVFVWKKFERNIETAGLVSQSKEVNFKYDRIVLKEIFENFNYLPEAIKQNPPDNDVISCNAGVFGGNDLHFFKQYTDEAFSFIDQNKAKLDAVNLGLANIIFEQYMFACLARKKGKDVTYVFPNLTDYFFLKDFKGVPHRSQYLHIIGPFKKETASEIWIEERLRLEFPAYYYRIKEMSENKVL